MSCCFIRLFMQYLLFVILLDTGVVFTNEIGLSVEGPFAILTVVFADTYVQEQQTFEKKSTQTVSGNKREFIPSCSQ